MSHDRVSLPRARTWRDIPQEVKPRAMSRGGRRRLALRGVRIAAGAAALAAAGWGAWQVAAALQSGAPQSLAPRIGPPVLSTDGVLDRAWLERTLELPGDATLASLDLDRLRARLMADGQVQAATLIRRFPATLEVDLSERTPVARVAVQEGSSPVRTLLVARDGVVYAGSGYDRGLVGSLPWLGGVRLAPAGSGFAPIPGMPAVAELLAQARMNDEPLYRTWRVVSLAGLASDGEIEVVAADGLKAIFGVREDFFRQIARLDLVLETAKTQTPTARVSRVDLSLGRQVPVAFDTGEPPPASPSAGFSFTFPSSAREF